jgi:hypothetical protein
MFSEKLAFIQKNSPYLSHQANKIKVFADEIAIENRITSPQ